MIADLESDKNEDEKRFNKGGLHHEFIHVYYLFCKVILYKVLS